MGADFCNDKLRCGSSISRSRSVTVCASIPTDRAGAGRHSAWGRGGVGVEDLGSSEGGHQPLAAVVPQHPGANVNGRTVCGQG
jgi:hypothetical protein